MGGKGTEIYYYPSSVNGKNFAEIIYNKVAPLTISPDRGIKTNSSFYVLRKTTSPAVLIETMFHDNIVDVNDYLEKINLIAKEMAKGIYQYFGINYNEKKIIYRIFAGSYENYSNALNRSNELKSKGIDNFIMPFEQ